MPRILLRGPVLAGRVIACAAILLATMGPESSSAGGVGIGGVIEELKGEEGGAVWLEATAGVSTFDQPGDTADGNERAFRMDAPEANVDSDVDDTAATVGAKAGAGMPLTDRLLMEAFASMELSEDYKTRTTARLGPRSTTVTSEFKPGMTLGAGLGLSYRLGGGWQIRSALTFKRFDFDIDIVQRNRLMQNGESVVVGELESQKSIEEWEACTGISAGRRLQGFKKEATAPVVLGVTYNHCSVNDSDFNQVLGFFRWDLGGRGGHHVEPAKQGS